MRQLRMKTLPSYQRGMLTLTRTGENGAIEFEIHQLETGDYQVRTRLDVKNKPFDQRDVEVATVDEALNHVYDTVNDAISGEHPVLVSSPEWDDDAPVEGLRFVDDLWLTEYPAVAVADFLVNSILDESLVEQVVSELPKGLGEWEFSDGERCFRMNVVPHSVNQIDMLKIDTSSKGEGVFDFNRSIQIPVANYDSEMIRRSVAREFLRSGFANSYRDAREVSQGLSELNGQSIEK